MSIARPAAILIALVLGGPNLSAQEHARNGPTIAGARAAFFTPAPAMSQHPILADAPASCGSSVKNAAMLGLGFSLAAIILEVTYTLVREPFVRRGRDLPPADPVLIAWAGGGGFVLGLIGTELCRRRRR